MKNQFPKHQHKRQPIEVRSLDDFKDVSNIQETQYSQKMYINCQIGQKLYNKSTTCLQLNNGRKNFKLLIYPFRTSLITLDEQVPKSIQLNLKGFKYGIFKNGKMSQCILKLTKNETKMFAGKFETIYENYCHNIYYISGELTQYYISIDNSEPLQLPLNQKINIQFKVEVI